MNPKGFGFGPSKSPTVAVRLCIVIRCNVGAIRTVIFTPRMSGCHWLYVEGQWGLQLLTFRTPRPSFPNGGCFFIWRSFMSSNNVDIADAVANTATVGLGIVHMLINILFPIAVIILMLKSCS